MASKILWFWDDTNKVFVKAQCDADGLLKVDMSAINLNDLNDTDLASPTDDNLVYWDEAAGKWQDIAHLGLPNAHHPQAHTLASHSTKAHAELSDAPENAHHTKFTAAGHTAIGDGSPHHTKYTDANALAAAIAGGLSKVIWKDTPERALADFNRTTTLGYTDLDLTALTSANAKLAILFLQMHVDSYTSGDMYMAVRKNGTTPVYLFLIRALAVSSANNMAGLMAVVGVDSGQVIEYTIFISGTGQIDSYIDVMGYIE